MNPKYDSEYIKDRLEEHDFRTLRNIFKENEAYDIAEMFEECEVKECISLFRLVPRSKRVDLFAHFETDLKLALLEELPDVITSALLNEMEADDRTRLLSEVPREIATSILQKLDPEERDIASQLLSYPENSVGRLMSPAFLALSQKMTVSEAIELIHWSTTLPIEYLNSLFVTADDGTLIGEVSLAALVVCDPPSKGISAVMKKSTVWLTVDQDESVAVEYFRNYDLSYIPVVDANMHILGIVTFDDLFDVAEEEATEDIHQFGGHQALDTAYLHTPIFSMFKKRAGWLIFLFLSGFISGEALRSFDSELKRWTFLAIFLPAILSAGGNSGTQAASLIIRGLALKDLEISDVWDVLKKEVLLALCLGVLLAGLSALRAYFWEYDSAVIMIISASVISVVIFGVLAGAMLPFVFQALKLDPAVASSPFISTLVDVSGILILFHIALFFLERLHLS